MKKLFTALLTLVLLFVLQVKAQQSCHTPIRNNTLNHLPDFCSGNMAFTVWGSLPTGGAGVFTYQWESSSDSFSWQVISTAIQQHYTSLSIISRTCFRRLVESGKDTSVTSAFLSWWAKNNSMC